jgi:anti-anti-sigma factor
MPRDNETPAPSYDTEVLRTTIEPGDEHRLVLAGELDLHGITAFTRAVGDLLHDKPNRVALDLTRVSFMDSAGLKALLGARRDLTATGSEFRLSDASDAVRRVIKLAGLVDVLLPA